MNDHMTIPPMPPQITCGVVQTAPNEVKVYALQNNVVLAELTVLINNPPMQQAAVGAMCSVLMQAMGAGPRVVPVSEGILPHLPKPPHIR